MSGDSQLPQSGDTTNVLLQKLVRATAAITPEVGGDPAGAAAAAIAAHVSETDPHPSYQLRSEKGFANGYAPLGSDNLVPSIHLPTTSAGKVLNFWQAKNDVPGSTTNPIPFDDTIPQSSEGVKILEKSITPSSASSYILVTVTGFALPVNISNLTVALFEDSVADCVATSCAGTMSAVYATAFCVQFIIPSWSGSKTLKAHIGASGATTLYWLRTNTLASIYGSKDCMMMIVQELEINP